MNSYLLSRSQGSISPTAFHYAQTTLLTQCLEPAAGIRFSNRAKSSAAPASRGVEVDYEETPQKAVAHRAGANVLAVDSYEKRFMVSGGADSSICLWDLEARGAELDYVHAPVTSTVKSKYQDAHQRALTSISFYPFDPTPTTILTTSHDMTLKLSALESSGIMPVHTFDCHSTPYSHSLSAHPSSLLLIAVGSSEKAVRLLDLRSGLSTHTLPGHTSSILSVAWAPHREYLLASASSDNRALIYDVRRGSRSSVVASLDMDDAVGVQTFEGCQKRAGNRLVREARAHNGAVTGVRWTDDGNYIVTAGQDSRIRVFNCTTGANTLVHFGPRVRNSPSLHLAERAPLLVPTDVTSSTQDMLLWPNYTDGGDRGEIYMFQMHEGKHVKTLTVPGLPRRRNVGQAGLAALSAGRINALAWRGNGASGQGIEMFSAHGDGTVRSWVSQPYEDDSDEITEEESADRKRKRDVLDDAYRGLMGANVTFT